MAAKKQKEARTYIEDEDGSLRLNPDAFAGASGAASGSMVNLPAPYQDRQVGAEEEFDFVNLFPGVTLIPDYKMETMRDKATGEVILAENGEPKLFAMETGREKLVAPGQPVRTLGKFCVGRWGPFVVYEPDCKTGGFEYGWSEESVIAYFKRAISNPAFAKARRDYVRAFKDFRGKVGLYFQNRADEIEDDRHRRMMGSAS